MSTDGEDLRRALIALSFGLEPVVFAIIGWYAGPYLKLNNVTGALIGVAVGLGIMFWRIWRFSLMLKSKAREDPEREDLRSIIKLVEVERYRIINRYDIIKIIGTQTPLQLLNVLKSLSLIRPDFYDLNKLNDVLSEVTDFSKVFTDVRARSPIEFLRVLDDLNDFLVILCANFAFRYEVYDDKAAKGYVVTPFRQGDNRSLLREDLKNYLANEDIRELYPKALDEALMINSRSPILALAAYSLLKVGRDLELMRYAYAYSNEVIDLAQKLFSIAINGLRREGKESIVIEILKQKIKKLEVLAKESEEDIGNEEDALKFFINNAYETLKESSRVPFTAKAVLSYLFIKWSEKVSLRLAFMVVNNELTPQEAYEALITPF